VEFTKFAGKWGVLLSAFDLLNFIYRFLLDLLNFTALFLAAR